MLRFFPVPGLDAGPWGVLALSAVALTGFVVLVYQAVRYFRNNRGDDE